MADGLGEIRAIGAGREVVLVRTLAAPPDAVWAALTRPELAVRWLGDLEVADDGYRLLPRDGSQVVGRVLVCVPGERLVATWQQATAPAGEVEVGLRPHDAGSSLRLVHRDLRALGAAERAAGWHVALDDLATAVGHAAPGATDGELVARYRQVEAGAVAGRTERRTDGWVVDVTRLLDAPIEDVWAAFTRRDRVARWLWPVLQWPVPDDAPWEPAVGDRVVFDDPDAPAEQAFEVLDVEAPRRLVVRFGAPGGGTRVTFTLEAQPGSTLLSVHQSATPGFVAGGQERGGPDFAAGWHALLDVLGTLLDGSPSPRVEELWAAAHAAYSAPSAPPQPTVADSRPPGRSTSTTSPRTS